MCHWRHLDTLHLQVLVLRTGISSNVYAGLHGAAIANTFWPLQYTIMTGLKSWPLFSSTTLLGFRSLWMTSCECINLRATPTRPTTLIHACLVNCNFDAARHKVRLPFLSPWNWRIKRNGRVFVWTENRSGKPGLSPRLAKMFASWNVSFLCFFICAFTFPLLLSSFTATVIPRNLASWQTPKVPEAKKLFQVSPGSSV